MSKECTYEEFVERAEEDKMPYWILRSAKDFTRFYIGEKRGRVVYTMTRGNCKAEYEAAKEVGDG